MDIPFGQLDKESYPEKDRAIIDGWENRAIELAEQENFRGHPVTIKLAEECRGQIQRIENILKDDENLPEPERRALFKEKKTHKFYLDLFTRDGSQELNMIAERVNEEI